MINIFNQNDKYIDSNLTIYDKWKTQKKSFKNEKN